MKFLSTLFFLCTLGSGFSAANKQPNILLILADDLGYGDVACYNPESKVPTPVLDQMASDGIRFTDAHSPATVCTPTRYSLMTGRMAFRTGRGNVFSGVGGPSLIEKDRLTLPAILRAKGYHTACFGKWHIGLTFHDKDGNIITERGNKGVKLIDYDRPIPDAPIHQGFDKFYGTACCPTTDWLYAYIDGDRIPVPPTQILDKSTIPDHFYALDCRPGLIAPNFDLEEVDMVFLRKSQEFLDSHFEETPEKPFFLFHSCQAVHLPSFPAKQFQGKTEAGPHGDFIHQLDWTVGELLASLEKHGVTENTLVIFASDNGPEVPSIYDMRRTYQHDGARPWRGVKRDQWEGGHRTPFIIKWPAITKEGQTCEELISLTDIFATCADIVSASYPEDAAEDSVTFLPILNGTLGETTHREFMIQQTNFRKLSIRNDNWKYIDHKGSGGNNYQKPGPGSMGDYAIKEQAPDAPGQLYDLSVDPGETNNLYFVKPEKAAFLKEKLDGFTKSGRSAPIRPKD